MKHFLFTQWPDHGAPATTRDILALYWAVKVAYVYAWYTRMEINTPTCILVHNYACCLGNLIGIGMPDTANHARPLARTHPQQAIV